MAGVFRNEVQEITFYGYSDYRKAERNGRRGSSAYRKFRVKVKRRDGNQCAKCGSTKNLEVHHEKQYVDNIFLRTKTNNGVTLCSKCHTTKHLWMKQEKPKVILRKANSAREDAEKVRVVRG